MSYGYIDWNDGVTTVNNLTLESFRNFADSNVDYIFERAFHATLKSDAAEELSVNALCRVLLVESASAAAKEMLPHDALDHALDFFLTKTQRANLANDSVKVDLHKILSPALADSIAASAEKKANKDMPRYAPTITGTTGTLVILTIVAFILAAAFLVYMDPAGLLGEDVSSSTSYSDLSGIRINSASRLDPSLLVDISAEVVYENADGDRFNGGCVPVKVAVSGPDIGCIKSISVSNDGNGESGIKIDQYAKNSYCFFANGNGIYKITAQDEEGASVCGYVNVYAISDESAQNGEQLAAGGFTASHIGQTTLTLSEAGAQLPSGASVSSGDFGVSDSDADTAEGDRTDAPEVSTPVSSGMLRIIKHPDSDLGTLELSPQDGSLVFTASEKSKNSVGVGSFTVSLNANGESKLLVIPLVVVNSEPTVSVPEKLSLLHTPTIRGRTAGRLEAQDIDGDDVHFALRSTEGCSVLLSDSGSYIVSVDENRSSPAASFSFTVSDGLIETEPVTLSIGLQNKLITDSDFAQNFVSYSGEDGWYMLALPTEDEDGDPLIWRVNGLLDDMMTQQGSQIMLADDGSYIKYRTATDKPDGYIEELSLTCTDGWLINDEVVMRCNVRANAAPAADSGNHTSITADTLQTVCEVKITDDCPFDKCAITGVANVVGGSITESAGWDELKFTFVPDGSESVCYVTLTVSDILTGKSSQVPYIIYIG